MHSATACTVPAARKARRAATNMGLARGRRRRTAEPTEVKRKCRREGGGRLEAAYEKG